MSHFTASLTIIVYIVCMRTRVTGSFHTSRCDINTGINVEAPQTGSLAPSLSLRPCRSESFIPSASLLRA